MKANFIPAVLPRDIRKLVAFDRKVFREADWFEPDDWKQYKSFWMVVSGKRVGCCAFAEHVPHRGSLYVASTGILPASQRLGFGTLLKAWQLAYARHHSFARIVTNTRKSNRAMIALNKRFGFRVTATTPRHYADPVEPAIVMELILAPRRKP